jgi:hypothetical protein
MNRPDQPGEKRTEPEQREPREKTIAPPIEREHETQQGAIEEDEKRKIGGDEKRERR